MQITTLSNQQLLNGIKGFVSKERKITSIIIEHLEEIERRKLYCDLKYQSLFKYCVKELGYSEDQACRRINAMRVVKKMPEVKKAIDSGAVTLTTLNLFSGASSELELNKNEKEDLMNRFKGKSKRACQLEVDQMRREKGKSVKKKPASIRADHNGKTRLSISLDDKLISTLRSLAAEKNESLEVTLSRLITKEKERVIGKVSALEQRKTKIKSTSKQRRGKEVGKGRYIPKKVKQIVRAKADYLCENCGSQHRLQYEHTKPIATGGRSELTNMKLLCSNCNLRSGVKAFGTKVMKRF